MAANANAVGWFEIPVRDIGRAQAFYEHVLGLSLQRAEMGGVKMAWFPWTEGAPGAAGSLVQGQGYDPSPSGTLVYFTAPDLDATVTRAVDKGGKLLLPRTSIGEYGYMAWVADLDGNRIALHSRT